MAKAGNGANFPVGQPGRPRPGSALRGEEEQQVENLVSLPIPLPGPGDKVVSVDVEPGETFLQASAKRLTKKEKIRMIICEIYRKLIFKVSIRFIHFLRKKAQGC